MDDTQVSWTSNKISRIQPLLKGCEVKEIKKFRDYAKKFASNDFFLRTFRFNLCHTKNNRKYLFALNPMHIYIGKYIFAAVDTNETCKKLLKHREKYESILSLNNRYKYLYCLISN